MEYLRRCLFHLVLLKSLSCDRPGCQLPNLSTYLWTLEDDGGLFCLLLAGMYPYGELSIYLYCDANHLLKKIHL